MFVLDERGVFEEGKLRMCVLDEGGAFEGGKSRIFGV